MSYFGVHMHLHVRHPLTTFDNDDEEQEREKDKRNRYLQKPFPFYPRGLYILNIVTTLIII